MVQAAIIFIIAVHFEIIGPGLDWFFLFLSDHKIARQLAGNQDQQAFL